MIARQIICVALATASAFSAPDAKPGEPETAELELAELEKVKQAIEQVMIAVRKSPEARWDRMLSPASTANSPERLQTLRLLRRWVEQARADAIEPMSELTPPLALVRDVVIDESGRATACIHMVRVGSLTGVRLGVYDAVVGKTAGVWRLASLSSAGRCQGLGMSPPLSSIP